MKTINIITAAVILALFITFLVNVQVTPKYEIHKTRSGDFIIIDGKNGGSRIYEVVELRTDRVTEAFK